MIQISKIFKAKNEYVKSDSNKENLTTVLRRSLALSRSLLGQKFVNIFEVFSGLTDQDHRVAVEKIIFFFFWVYQIDSTVSPVSPESQPWNECTQLKTTESKATHHKPMQCIQMYFASSTILT